MIENEKVTDINVYFVSTTYGISFNTNGGTINSGNVETYNKGEGATLPTDVTREGYTFDGWYDNEGLTGEVVTSISTTETEAKAYWAKWTPNKYTITFDANGYGTAPDSQSVVYGNTITKPENLSAEGYIFAGWFKEKSCENEWDFDKDTIKEDTVIYTKWIEFGEKEIATDVKKDEKVTGSKSHKSYRRFCRVYTVR